MCASPTDTVAFIPGLGYALQPVVAVWMILSKAVPGVILFTGLMVHCRRDSKFKPLADLEGATWGYGDQGSTSGTWSLPLVCRGRTPW
ncbi:hypothetical protein [Candidatus Villigracilis saccharophilus]|uniref:hypothetical protein n=1 Tax=Candidatus Villigracilis saccharophilus TaxID=3140684 RepID=UPI003134B9EE|nr:hypothetical protein [Anaerolineales bacterium]